MSRPLSTALVTCLAALSLQAQEVNTLREGGNPADRIDLVVLAEGYTSDQERQFLADARFVMRGVFAHPLFARYADFFNVHTVFQPARDVGILNHDARQGPGGSVYGTRFVGPDTTVVSAEWSRVQRATLDAPDVDRIVVLCNDPRNIGSRSGNVVFLSHEHPVDTALHELAHTLANLADEYVRRGRWTSAQAVRELRLEPRPNVAPLDDLDALPWAHWLEGSPALALPGHTGVGAWEGGYYVARGVVRPRENGCRMRYYRTPGFCEPCREALVSALYRLTSPSVAEYEPTEQGALLRVRSAVPRETRQLTWSAHGATPELAALLQRATDSNALELRVPAQLLSSRLELAVELVDATPWLRRDRDALRFRARFALDPSSTGLRARLVDGDTR